VYWLKAILRPLRSEILALPTRMIVVLFVTAILLFPAFTQETYFLRIVILAAIFAMYAVSWDVLSGYAGQISLGHALFFAVGAYASGAFDRLLSIPVYAAIPLGAMTAAATGLVVAVPCLRLRKHHLALATLAFPLMLAGVVLMIPQLRGEYGLDGLARLSSSRIMEYYIIVGTMLAVVFVLWKLMSSRLGLIFHAIREDETVVRAVGIHTIRYKIVAFTLSGLTAGLAGALYAHFLTVAGIRNLDLLMSFQPVIWTVFGGVATIHGAVAGVFVLFPIVESLRAIPAYRMLVFALLLLGILRFMPGGVGPWIRDRLEKACPHCNIRNAFTRRTCRTCRTDLS
jgi:branched-chain amino acid transport system permease protein